MQILIFSKNRALQLDCTLSSFLLHCQDKSQASMTVLYQADGPLYERQYQQLMAEYSAKSVRFRKQMKFKADVMEVLLEDGRRNWLDRRLLSLGFGVNRMIERDWPENISRNILFLVDDNIFVCDFRLDDIEKSLAGQPDAVGFSLRLGANTTYCYPMSENQALPEFQRIDGDQSTGGTILRYRWPGAQHDFGYPLEVSSSAYRKSDILSVLVSSRFRNPNQLEWYLSGSAERFVTSHPWLLCYETSVTFCNPVNKVQTKFQNRAGENDAYTIENLAEKFDAGFRIDAAAYANYVSNGCHQEKELIFNKFG